MHYIAICSRLRFIHILTYTVLILYSKATKKTHKKYNDIRNTDLATESTGMLERIVPNFGTFQQNVHSSILFKQNMKNERNRPNPLQCKQNRYNK